MKHIQPARSILSYSITFPKIAYPPQPFRELANIEWYKTTQNIIIVFSALTRCNSRFLFMNALTSLFNKGFLSFQRHLLFSQEHLQSKYPVPKSSYLPQRLLQLQYHLQFQFSQTTWLLAQYIYYFL